jgi:L-threonine kinase
MNATGRKIMARVPCTCGELFQGTVYGEPCLVSCPIAINSQASLADDQSLRFNAGRKVRQALEKFGRVPIEVEGIVVENTLPVGRGFGTSTADIGAALYAICAECGVDLSAEEAARTAVSVEPTDSTLFPGLTLFAHRNGKFSKFLGAAPAAEMLIIDPGGFVDSEQFNRQSFQKELALLAGAHRTVFEQLEKGIRDQDIYSIGDAASRSAELHQIILFNHLLEPVIKLARQVGAAGVCRAHSGTILGLLFEADYIDESRMIEYCRKHLPANVQLINTRLADGGATVTFIPKNNEMDRPV